MTGNSERDREREKNTCLNHILKDFGNTLLREKQADRLNENHQHHSSPIRRKIFGGDFSSGWKTTRCESRGVQTSPRIGPGLGDCGYLVSTFWVSQVQDSFCVPMSVLSLETQALVLNSFVMQGVRKVIDDEAQHLTSNLPFIAFRYLRVLI